MENLHFEIPYRKLKYVIDVPSRYVLIRGLSASGKSTFIDACDLAIQFSHDLEKRIGTVASQPTISGTMALFMNNNVQGKVCVIDEDAYTAIRNSTYSNVLANPLCRLVIIGRTVDVKVYASYKDFYVMSYKDGINHLVREFPDLDKWVVNDTYVTEDSRSGHLYFKTRCNNVTSAFGRDNLVNKPVESVLIADGAAIAPIFAQLWSKHYRMFLPDSFEELVLSYFKPDVVKDALRKCPERTITLEKYFEQIINDCGLPFRYSKDYLQREVYNATLIPELSEIINPLPESYFEEHELKEKRKAYMLSHKYYDQIVRQVQPIEKARAYIAQINEELDLERPLESLKEIYERM